LKQINSNAATNRDETDFNDSYSGHLHNNNNNSNNSSSNNNKISPPDDEAPILTGTTSLGYSLPCRGFKSLPKNKVSLTFDQITKQGGPRYLRVFYFQICLFTSAKLVQMTVFKSKCTYNKFLQSKMIFYIQNERTFFLQVISRPVSFRLSNGVVDLSNSIPMSCLSLPGKLL